MTREAACDPPIVGHDQERRAADGRAFLEQRTGRRGMGIVKGGGGFIGDQQTGFSRQRAGDGGPLRLALRQRTWEGTGATSDSQAIEERHDEPGVLCSSGKPPGERQIAQDVEGRDKAERLEDDSDRLAPHPVGMRGAPAMERHAVDQEPALLRCEKAGKKMDERRFARARGTEKHRLLAPVEGEADGPDAGTARVAEDKILGGEQHRP